MIDLIFLLAAIPYFFIGHCIIYLLRVEFSFNEKFSYSFGLGVGAIALQMVFYSSFSIDWGSIHILTPWIVLFLLFRFVIRRKGNFPKFTFPFFSITDSFLFLAIFLLVILTLFESQLRPLIAWDGWATWIFRAKIFYHEGFINAETLKYYGSNYPLLLSLGSAAFYYFLGFENDRYVLILYPIFYLSTIILFYSFISQKTTKTFALLFTFAIFSSQILIRQGGRFEAGQADLPLAFYILGSSLLFFKYIKTPKVSNLVIFSLFLSITALIKNEGVPFAIIMSMPVFIFMLKIKKLFHVAIYFLWTIPVIHWVLFQYIHDLPKNIHFLGSTSSLTSKVYPLVIGIMPEFIDYKRWGFLWVGFFIAGFLYFVRKKYSYEISVLYYLVLSQFGVYIIIFLITPHPLASYIPNVLDRLLLHISIIASIPTALVIYSILQKNKIRK